MPGDGGAATAVERRRSDPRADRGASMASVTSNESALGDVHLPPPPPLDEQAEDDDRARQEEEARERERREREAEARARRTEEARARREAEAHAKAEAEAKANARREAEARAQREAEAKAQREAAETKAKAQREAEAKAKAQREAEAKAKAQREAAEAESKAQREAAEASAAAPKAASSTPAARSPPDYHAPHSKPGDDVLKRLGITPQYGNAGDDEYPTFKADNAVDNKTFELGSRNVRWGRGGCRRRGCDVALVVFPPFFFMLMPVHPVLTRFPLISLFPMSPGVARPARG